MRPSLWRTLGWSLIGILFYLAGMVLFLIVAVNVFLEPPTNSMANLSIEHVLPMVLSVALIVLGRTITWKFGGGLSMTGGIWGTFRDDRPDQSPLEEMGYRVPDESSDEAQFAYDDGQMYVVCSNCGTKNERGYSYCSDCSAELPK